MEEPKILPLDYASVKPRETKPLANPGLWLGCGFALVMIQIVGWLPVAIWLGNALADGSPKQPFMDFCFYMVPVMPSIFAIASGVLHCRLRHQQYVSLRTYIPAILVMVVSGLFVACSVYYWFEDDIRNRSIPHILY